MTRATRSSEADPGARDKDRVEFGGSASDIHGSREFLRSTAELPSVVYRSVIFAFGWMLFMAWLAFGERGRPDFVIFISVLIFSVMIGIPVILRAANPAHPSARFKTLDEFLSSPIETATGTLIGRKVWIQIAIIPVALALMATAFGLVYVLET